MKVLLIATVQSHICQFHKPLVERRHGKGWEVHVAARNNLAEKNGLKLDFVKQVFDVPFHRSPFSLKNIEAYRQLKRIIRDGDYDVIHCNTPVGGVLGRLAARKARRRGTRVFYTAHGFHFYRGAPKKNWLIWYPIEKLMSRYCDVLITIAEEDYELARKSFPCRVEHIHGVGVDAKRFHPIPNEERVQRRREEDLSDEDFVVLCVGELNANKNQDKLIHAAALLEKQVPNLRVLLAGNGPRESEYQRVIAELGLTDHIKLLGYRTDLEKITPAVDLVVSCSLREGMPLNIIEAMLCSKPVVASENRGHKELIENGVNGFLVDPNSISGYAAYVKKLSQDMELANRMGNAGFEKAQVYSTETVTKELETLIKIM